MVLPRAALLVGVALVGATQAQGAVVSTYGDCFEYGYTYTGYDIAEESGVLASHDCMKLCVDTRGCSFWSWDRHTKACYLKGAGALTGRVPQPSVVSGPRQCVYGPTCFDHEFDYPGYDIEKIEDRFVVSPTECQQLCTMNPQCAFFSWKASSYSCYLKAAPAPLSRGPDSDVVSGPRVCPSHPLDRNPGSAAVEFDPAQAPPTCAEPNVEYRGNNVDSTTTKTAHECQMKCTANDNCAYWTWNLGTHACHLKNADAISAKFSDETTLGKISAAKDCIPVMPGCQFAHVGVVGASLSTTKAKTYEGCQLACLTQRGCSHWTLDTASSVCTLWASFTAYTKGAATFGLVSGPLHCESDQTCFEEGDFVGYDIEKIETGEVKSPAECQHRCRANSECHFWTWFAESNSCYLKNRDAVLGKRNDVTSLGRYSGPKQCSITYGCVKLNVIYQGARIKEMPLPDHLACAAACKAMPTCSYWNYFSDHKYCQLEANGASLRYETLGGTLAGTRYCPQIVESQQDEHCFEQGVRYAIDNIVTIKEGVSSASECYAACQAVDKCKWFSYVDLEHCYLLGYLLGNDEPQVVYDTMSISGPSSCPDEYEDSFGFKGYRYTAGEIVEKATFVYTVGACAQQCENFEGCSYWSYVRGLSGRNCFLFDSSAAGHTVDDDMAVSGQRVMLPFLARNCTFTKPFASARHNNPVTCQVECERHENCAFWTWSYTIENTLVGVCELFAPGARQVDADSSSNSICGSKWTPGMVHFHMKFAEPPLETSPAHSLAECDEMCMSNTQCGWWSVNPASGDCHLHGSQLLSDKLKRAEGFISVKANRNLTPLFPGKAFVQRNRKGLSSKFARSRLQGSRSAIKSIDECQEACRNRMDCLYWTYSEEGSPECSLFNYATTMTDNKRSVSGSRHAPRIGAVHFDHVCAQAAPALATNQLECMLGANCWDFDDTCMHGDGVLPQDGSIAFTTN